jgi:hypothetical protein
MEDQSNNTLGYKLRLFSKRLSSGNYQITFHAKKENEDKKYGHVLVPKGSSLKEVVLTIRSELRQMRNGDNYYHGHLYSLGKPPTRNQNLVIFDR